MKNPVLFGKLIGLVRCTEGNEHLITPHTHALIKAGLQCAVNGGDHADLLQQIEDEKRRLAPDCFCCATPCGKRDDMDFSLLVLDDENVQMLKKRLLHAIENAITANKDADYATALFLYGLIGTGEDPIINILNTL